MLISHEGAGFWGGTLPAARWALVAAMFMAVVTVVPFVVMVMMVSIERHISPQIAVFGPLPGNPLIVWIYYTLPPAALQAAAGLAMRDRRIGLQVTGTVGTLLVAVAALAWLGGIVYAVMMWLLTGVLTAGDFADLLGMVVLGIPVLTVVAVLDLRAAFLSVRTLIRHEASPAT